MAVFEDDLPLLSTKIYFVKQRGNFLKMQRVDSISTLTSLRVEFLCTKCTGQLFLPVTWFFAVTYQVAKLLVSQ